MNIREYISVSSPMYDIQDVYTNADDFLIGYKKIYQRELNSYLRHYIINNIPYVFRESPLIYEQLIKYMADKIQINPNEIKLVGSAKTGFSMAKFPEYGKANGCHSDLDFAIINEKLFNQLTIEFNTWSKRYKENVFMPRNDKEKYYWDLNKVNVPSQINRGHIDTNKIPNKDELINTKKINGCCYLIKTNLEKIHKMIISRANVRVYQSWDSFNNQLTHNIQVVLDDVYKNKYHSKS